MRRKLLTWLVLVFVLVLASNHDTPKAHALSGSDFNPGRIIDDSVFFNKDAMTAVDIQNFLNSKVPVCDVNGDKPYYGTYGGVTYNGNILRKNLDSRYPPPYTCLRDYYENTTTKENNVGRPSYRPPSSISAAQIIYNEAQAYNISPKVLLVLIQKESYGPLITDDWPWPTQYRAITGWGCPDGGSCNADFYGVYNQIHKSALQFWLYATYPDDPDYGAKAGVYNNIRYNPNISCGTQTVFIQNQATAGLYNYTPYVPNAAALNNLYGLGDSCSAYGNRNFWRLYNDWFGSTLANRAWNGEVLDGTAGSIVKNAADMGSTSTSVQFGSTLQTFYYDQTSGNLQHTWYNDSGWHTEVLDGTASAISSVDGDFGKNARAVVIGSLLHVFYYDQTNGNLRHAWADGTGWHFEVLDGAASAVSGFESNLGQSISVTVFNSQLQLFYYDQTNGNLRHAWTNSAGWRFENLDGDSGSIARKDANLGLTPSVTVFNSQLQLFYYDQTNGNLRHAWTNSAGWRFENLDGDSGSIARKDANLGLTPSVTVFNSQLQLFYYDQTNGNLRHAWTNSAGWRFENLDGDSGSVIGNSVDAGIAPSATVYGSSLHLFYYDSTSKILRHTWPN